MSRLAQDDPRAGGGEVLEEPIHTYVGDCSPTWELMEVQSVGLKSRCGLV